MRCPPPVQLLALSFSLLLAAGVAHAQVEQRSMRLNVPTLASQYLDITFEATLEGNPAYRIEAWVNPTSFSTFPTIVGNDYRLSYWLGLNSLGQVRFYPTGGAGRFVESSSSVPLNGWTHVAATYDGSTETIYLNGVVAATSSAFIGAVGTSPSADVFVGADREAGGPTYFWQGYLDEVRIWNAARSAANIIETMYTGCSGFGMPLSHYAGLLAWWDMQNPPVGGVFDRAPGTYNFANEVNGADFDPQGPPLSYNLGLELDGVDDFVSAPLADGFTGGLTIEAWIAPYTYPVNACIAGRNFQTSFYLGLDASGHVRFYPTGGIGNFVSTTATVPIGVWTHVAATYRPGDTRIYLNGTLAFQSSATTAPVGDNGADLFIGADRSGATPNYFFNGVLDNVAVTRGALNGVQIRTAMFRQGIFGTSVMVPDLFGVLRERLTYRMDPFTAGTMNGGTSARFVRSGAALAQQLISDVAAAGIEGYRWSRVAIPYPLPDGTGSSTSVGTDLLLSGSGTISSVRVFVCAATSDLSKLHVTLRAPSLTTIDLLALGAGVGRDLHTVFDDGAPLPLSLAVSPYPDKVQPSSALSTFNGQPSDGDWRLSVVMSGSATVALWSWGLQINGDVLAVGEHTPAREIGLLNAGANPIVGSGAVTFALPAAANVDLAVFDLTGRRVRSLLSGSRDAGRYAMGWNAAGLSPGTYFLRLNVDGRRAGSLKVTIAR